MIGQLSSPESTHCATSSHAKAVDNGTRRVDGCWALLWGGLPALVRREDVGQPMPNNHMYEKYGSHHKNTSSNQLLHRKRNTCMEQMKEH